MGVPIETDTKRRYFQFSKFQDHSIRRADRFHIKTCMADASSAARMPRPLYERYASSMRRADNIIKAFDFSAGIRKRQARLLTADGAKLRQLKTGFAEKTKSARTQIRSLHIAAAKKRASQTAYAAATRPDAQARIAQMESDHIKTSIDAYMSYLGSLRHAETALNRYASAYAPSTTRSRRENHRPRLTRRYGGNH